jgi:CCR4-NOT transcription complex subunit 1
MNNDVRDPRILSNFEVFLSVNNLKDLLDNYFRTKNPELISEICVKMNMSKEKINGKLVPYSAVINALVLYIACQFHKTKKSESGQEDFSEMQNKEHADLFMNIANKLNNETRNCLLNSIVNELRYPNTHTFFFSLILISPFMDSKPSVI